MAEDAVRCSKCGGTLSDGTCTGCGAADQSIKCEHCGAACPPDSKWCPSCGRHLSHKAGDDKPDPIAAPGGSPLRLVLLLGLICLACYLVWRLQPEPVSMVLGALALLFVLPAGSLTKRLERLLPLLGGALLAGGATALLQPQLTTTFRRALPEPARTTQSATAGGSQQGYGYQPGAVMARFTDNGPDQAVVHQALDRVLGEHEGEAAFPATSLVERFEETENADTHDVEIDFNPAIPVSEVVQALSQDSHTVFAEPDYNFHALYTPNDPHYDEPYSTSRAGELDQWYLRTIGGPEAWDLLKDVQSEIRLAIIDTGIDMTHPDLKNRMARDSKGNSIQKNFLSKRVNAMDDQGHGTHCAGIADAETDNNNGVAGVAFNSVKLVAAKVLSKKGSGSLGGISRAITWCADQGCRVESLSLGGGPYTQSMQDAINYAWKKGVIIVAAAGNDSSSQPGYPAGNFHVVAVSATNEYDKLAPFSNFGQTIAVGAPGVNILATLPTYPCDLTRNYKFYENYDALSGTSMACPVVAGTLAALLAYQPTLKPEEAIQRLQQTADNAAGTDTGGWEGQFGYGRVNLANCILNRTRAARVGGVYGQVLDRRGMAVRGVKVSCGEQAVITTWSGIFRFPNLSPGPHTLSATLSDVTREQKVAVAPGADVNTLIELR